jgi:hypothetical protein
MGSDRDLLGGALDANHVQAKAEIPSAAMFLSDRTDQCEPGIAAIGFSLGAYYVLDLSVALYGMLAGR